MDHMMPEMDGIETTAAIRAWEKENGNSHKQIPIIALTANAVSGMKEMFIEKDFNDLLAKPIDVSKLDEILARWIPKEKRESGKGDLKPEDEKKFIIMADDNPANLKLGKSILSGKYRVATSPSAEKMFNLLENNHPAIILLDIDMPQMNGYDAIKILKSKPETKDIPVIFLTAKEEIVSDPTRLQLGGVKRNMTALFTDVQGFSPIAEALSPEQLVDLLNYYLSSMSDIILDQKGTIDKYEGDAIISFFGAPIELPDHVLRACSAAVIMKRAEKEVNRQIMEKRISPSPLLTRIGISAGEMVVGNMGTEKKMNYTIR
jgi:CheY-like chemotaxis protein